MTVLVCGLCYGRAYLLRSGGLCYWRERRSTPSGVCRIVGGFCDAAGGMEQDDGRGRRSACMMCGRKDYRQSRR